MSLLIVDDTPDNILLLKTILNKYGVMEVQTAESAKAAYEILELGQGREKEPGIDLIFMDIMMPEISGIDAVRAIKGEDRLHDIPIIMVTARTDMEALEEAFDAGAMDYVTKPINRVELRARMQSALRLKKETDTRKAKTRQLQQALLEIKTLRGFIPVCAYCKSIRDDAGAWDQMEVYIQKHADVEFSHGICPNCEKRLTRELEDREQRKKENKPPSGE